LYLETFWDISSSNKTNGEMGMPCKLSNPPGGGAMTRYGTKEFLADLRKGMRSEELMLKYNLSEEKLEQIYRMLRRSDLVALRRLWEQDKLSETQFMRAFSEVESDLKDKE
jgi:hypothetical protein